MMMTMRRRSHPGACPVPNRRMIRWLRHDIPRRSRPEQQHDNLLLPVGMKRSVPLGQSHENAG